MAPTPKDLEEAVPADSSAATDEASSKRLSTVSKMYDINKDGELDEAELAMRKLDKSGRGYLTNDKVYAMMQEQLKMQREMFKFKKIIFGLIGLVAVLALCNLGTSFASAILAKDTTTNTNSQLVDKKTEEVVATGSAVNIYTANAPSDQSSRKLSCTTQGKSTQCTITSFDQVDVADGKRMVDECRAGVTTVKFERVYSSTLNKQVTICNRGNGGGCEDTYRNVGTDFPSVELCNGISIRPNADETSYIISGDEATSDEFEGCDSITDCDGGLECTFNGTMNVYVCTEPIVVSPDDIPTGGGQAAAGSSCSSDSDCEGFNHVCFNTTATDGGRCGQCDPYNTTGTGTGCEDTNVPVCYEADDNDVLLGVGTCDCNPNDDETCPGGQTCSSVSFLGDSNYCSSDHDGDWCRDNSEDPNCVTTTIAPKTDIPVRA